MRFKLIALLVIVATIVAACGATPSTPTLEPQTGDDTVTEEAGDDSGDTGGSTELSESFSGATAASGTLSLNYPAGYTQSGTADALALTNTDTASGISVSVMPSVAATTMGSTPAEILASFASNAAAAGVTYSEPEEVTFGSNPGAIVTATANGVDSQIAIVEVNDAYVFVTLSGAENAANRATLEAVASSITLE